MPLDRKRLKALREIKALKQDQLSGLTQNQVTNCERLGTDSIELLEKLATALDCTPNFLLGRGFKDVDFEVPTQVRPVASRLAFGAFAARIKTTDVQRQRCRRVRGHRAAPLTADGWATLAEQIDLAVPPKGEAPVLRAVDSRGKI